MQNPSLVINNQSLRPLIHESYSPEHLAEIRQLLETKGTLDFPRLSTGLFSAAAVTAASAHTGYRSVWVRDNVHIAYAHYKTGKRDVAIRTVKALLSFFAKQRTRFDRIIGDPTLAAEPMNRPHIRFDGDTLNEVDETWAHAQNDALGYFLWLCCLMATDGAIAIGEREAEVLACFPRYFEAIRFWEDEDSGHWEEVRKISASSIGVVVAGLREMKRLVEGSFAPALRQIVSMGVVSELLERGENALQNILPSECIQSDPKKNRRYDAALLFLVYPLGVIKGELAERIFEHVIVNLQGDYGIKRYLGDSFWCTDYKRIPPELRTVDYSMDLSSRDKLFTTGGEAQWCLFDPVISAYFGERYKSTSAKFHLARQTFYFNRSLGQITGADCPWGEFKCPELYYQEGGKMETSEATPLLWTQANLWMALSCMERSVKKRSGNL